MYTLYKNTFCRLLIKNVFHNIEVIQISVKMTTSYFPLQEWKEHSKIKEVIALHKKTAKLKKVVKNPIINSVQGLCSLYIITITWY